MNMDVTTEKSAMLQIELIDYVSAKIEEGVHPTQLSLELTVMGFVMGYASGLTAEDMSNQMPQMLALARNAYNKVIRG